MYRQGTVHGIWRSIVRTKRAQLPPREFVGTVNPTSRCSRLGSRLLETGALPGRSNSSSSSLPCHTHAATVVSRWWYWAWYLSAAG